MTPGILGETQGQLSGLKEANSDKGFHSSLLKGAQLLRVRFSVQKVRSHEELQSCWNHSCAVAQHRQVFRNSRAAPSNKLTRRLTLF